MNDGISLSKIRYIIKEYSDIKSEWNNTIIKTYEISTQDFAVKLKYEMPLLERILKKPLPEDYKFKNQVCISKTFREEYVKNPDFFDSQTIKEFIKRKHIKKINSKFHSCCGIGFYKSINLSETSNEMSESPENKLRNAISDIIDLSELVEAEAGRKTQKIKEEEKMGYNIYPQYERIIF